MEQIAKVHTVSEKEILLTAYRVKSRSLFGKLWKPVPFAAENATETPLTEGDIVTVAVNESDSLKVSFRIFILPLIFFATTYIAIDLFTEIDGLARGVISLTALVSTFFINYRLFKKGKIVLPQVKERLTPQRQHELCSQKEKCKGCTLVQ